MGAPIDLLGRQFGRLVVVAPAEGRRSPNGKARRYWHCRCECGQELDVLASNLTCGYTTSCGCLQKERAIEANQTHGDTDGRLYNVWCSMKARCFNPNEPAYHRYGGRGIAVCDEWKDDYAAFKKWAMALGYDPEAPRGQCTLDRIDNDKGYSPQNCRWVTQQEQMNNVSYNHRLEYQGDVHTMAEWARIFRMPYGTFQTKLRRHMTTITLTV